MIRGTLLGEIVVFLCIELCFDSVVLSRVASLSRLAFVIHCMFSLSLQFFIPKKVICLQVPQHEKNTTHPMCTSTGWGFALIDCLVNCNKWCTSVAICSWWRVLDVVDCWLLWHMFLLFVTVKLQWMFHWTNVNYLVRRVNDSIIS